MSRHSMGEMGEDLCPKIFHPLLKILTNGAVTTDAEIQFPYFTTLTEKAGPLIWAVAHTLEYLVPHRLGGRKDKLGPISKTPVNINTKSY